MNAKDPDGYTSLMIAIELRDVPMTELLLKQRGIEVGFKIRPLR